jgi:methionine biosynthesis protein MetW
MPEQAFNKPLIHQWIVDHTTEGSRVLDIGCGEGELLARLAEEKGVKGTGIELSEACVIKAVQRGLSVHHGDVEEGLDHYADGFFDQVILSLTIQELRDPKRVLEEAFRVGKKAIVVFPNFAYWRSRWQLAVLGRAPTTQNLPHSWFESPNRHFLTVRDWDSFYQREECCKCLARGFLSSGKPVRHFPNLFAEVAMYLLEGCGNSTGSCR